MTHDELLEQIQKDINEKAFIMDEYYPVKMLFALRAVVELHRPAWYNSRDTDIKDAYCVGCDNRCGCYEGDILDHNTWESCPTIQAIEKELSNG